MAVALLGVSVHLLSASYTPPSKFLLVSNPASGEVGYMKIQPSEPSSGTPHVHSLISKGLTHPQGLAVDQRRRMLFIADPNLNKLVAYQLAVEGDSLRASSSQIVVADNVETRWVTVDGRGNVFFSDESRNLIMKVTAQQMLDGDAVAEAIYSSDEAPSISAPGGVAVDNYNVFWTNKLSGDKAGTLVKGPDAPSLQGSGQSSLSVLARNAVKSFGVCVAMDDVFFTDDSSKVYGMRRDGVQPVTLTNEMESPRGCVWDGDNTVYVADRTHGAIFAFPAPMPSLAEVAVRKVVDYDDAFGLAVISSGAGRGPRPQVAAIAMAGLIASLYAA